MKSKPELKGLPILIHVAAQHPLSEQAGRFYEMVKQCVVELGVALEFDLGGKLIKES